MTADGPGQAGRRGRPRADGVDRRPTPGHGRWATTDSTSPSRASSGVAYAWAAYVLGGRPLALRLGRRAAGDARAACCPTSTPHSGVELKGFTGILGVLAAVAVWQELGRARPAAGLRVPPLGGRRRVRPGAPRAAAGADPRSAVHRGISHSFPTCAVWGALAYLYYPTRPTTSLRLMMAVAVMLGFLSHLLLDEICSVDLQGARVNKAFGTAHEVLGAVALVDAGDLRPAELPDLAGHPDLARSARSASPRPRPRPPSFPSEPSDAVPASSSRLAMTRWRVAADRFPANSRGGDFGMIRIIGAIVTVAPRPVFERTL